MNTSSATETTIAVNPTDREFEQIYGSEWAWRNDELGDQSFSEANRPPSSFLPDCGPDRQQERLARWERVLGALDRLAIDRLSPATRSNWEVYRAQIQVLVDQQRFRMYERPANADTSFWNTLVDQTRRQLTTAAEAEAYLRQLAGLGRYLGQQIDNMRAGVGRGFGPPQISMRGREATIRSVAEATPEQSPFRAPFRTLRGRVAAPCTSNWAAGPSG